MRVYRSGTSSDNEVVQRSSDEGWACSLHRRRRVRRLRVVSVHQRCVTVELIAVGRLTLIVRDRSFHELGEQVTRERRETLLPRDVQVGIVRGQIESHFG